MTALNLNSFAENASRLGMRLQETLSERTRDLSIARGSSSARFLDNVDDKAKNIRKQLDSSSDREKLDAMKRLIALISKGRNVSEYFAQVVKNVASHNLEIRKLVYIYLLRYAEQEPDLALLSINTFQKDLNDHNPLIRAMALRVLSGIKVPMIGSIVVLAIKKCAADPSPYVRKGAALAIPKCYDLDSNHLPELTSVISDLLADRSPLPLGAVSVAFEAVCPTRLELLHKHFRRLCKVLVDVDEWGQIDLLGLLTRYSRTMLSRPYIHDDDLSEEVDVDLKLLLSSSEPLLQSRNPAVVLAVSRLFYYAAPPSQVGQVVQPLLRLLQVSREVERVVLAYVLVITRALPHLFSSSYSRFLLRADDIREVKLAKIELLLNVLTADNHQALLREFITHVDDPEDEIASESMRALGRCARIIPDSAQQCMSALMALLKSPHDVIVSNAVVVLKSLVQTQLMSSSISSSRSSQSPYGIIALLARRIDDIRHHQARACIFWMAGQYCIASNESNKVTSSGIADWAPDLLRKGAKSFTEEDALAKLQIMTFAAKLLVLSPTDRILVLLKRYIFSLARYDLNYDVRDRSRMLSSLFAGRTEIPDNDEREDKGGVILRLAQIKVILFEGKVGVAEEDQTGTANLTYGSLASIFGKDIYGDIHLPDWLEQGIDPSLRDNKEDSLFPSAPANFSEPWSKSIPNSQTVTPVILTPTGGSPSTSGPPQKVWADLDKFYEQSNTDSGGDDYDDDDDSDEEEEEEDGDEGDEEEEEGERSDPENSNHGQHTSDGTDNSGTSEIGDDGEHFLNT